MVLVAGCQEVALLSDVTFSKTQITPNADGRDDALRLSYDIGRSANVSIYFENEAGERYTFREQIYHGPSVDEPYQMLFSGVVDGYLLPGEAFEDFTIQKRVLRDGEYTWWVEATDTEGVSSAVSGTLTIADADTALPELRGFRAFPPVFTPNRDGINDRATINVDLKKDVAEWSIYVESEDGEQYPVEWQEKLTPLHEAGWHEFDWDAGVDHGADPPPDGTYTVAMEARDAVGQWTYASDKLTIEDGGVPRAYILNAEVDWSGDGPRVSIPLGGTLHFTLTVENDGEVPIRTSGPPPGTVYASDQNYATLEEYIQSGAFRVGIHCENSGTDHPWRWAVGGPDDLVTDEGGYRYLPAGERAMVTGGITFEDYIEARNPQYCYASLIHEDVQISLVNNRVDPVAVYIEAPEE